MKFKQFSLNANIVTMAVMSVNSLVKKDTTN